MMKLQKMRKHSFFIAFFIALTCFSQNYKASLNQIEKDGLHKIMLTSEIRAASKNNFNYLRIEDSLGQEVPYILKYTSDKFFSTFLPIKIQSKKRIKDSITSILIENKTGEKRTNLILQIANTDISKRYNLYGSNNAKQWFGLTSNKTLYLNSYANKLSIEKRINFPVNTYRFLKIEFNDKNSSSINILGVGVYENKFFSEKPIVITDFSQETFQLKERKVTQIKFTSKNYQKINTLFFNVKTAFYLRNAKLIVKRKRRIKKRDEIFDKVISSFQLNSKKENIFLLNNFNEKEFIVEIDNQDNPPLQITEIKLLQKPIYIISNLKKKEKYQFLIDTTFSKPSYDLGNFISENILNIEETFINDFSKIKNAPIIIKAKQFWQTSIFMWICIIFVGILVIYFALDLLKDIKHQESK